MFNNLSYKAWALKYDLVFLTHCLVECVFVCIWNVEKSVGFVPENHVLS